MDKEHTKKVFKHFFINQKETWFTYQYTKQKEISSARFHTESGLLIGFSAPPLGDIESLETRPDNGYIIQSGAYIASTQNVRLDTEWQGFKKGLFGTQLFMLKTTGEGQVFFNAFGALEKIVLEANKTITVDNYHLVAFTDSCRYNVTKFGSLKSTIFGGEGLVTEVTGPGDIYIQTKSPSEFAKWITPFLPIRRDSRGAGPQINVGGFTFGPRR